MFEVAYKKVAVVTSHLGSHSKKMRKMLPNHSIHSFFNNMTICSLFLHQVNAEAVGTSNTNLNSAPSMNTSRSTDLFIILCSYHHFSTNGMVLPPFIQTYHPQPLYSLRRRANARNTSLFISSRRKFHLYQLINLFDSISIPLETHLSCND